jgi:hypothetical protein
MANIPVPYLSTGILVTGNVFCLEKKHLNYDSFLPFCYFLTLRVLSFTAHRALAADQGSMLNCDMRTVFFFLILAEDGWTALHQGLLVVLQQSV